ncbi:hypothetical protein DR864_00485 [Runella rosea]|uniref:Uncharacterized protein n=1 Tax=Runella rosea TaxID=2259595 RepID=A0A344TCD9_9BACT|nr:hypothetical protein [Runella rosea]AXE16310.1 hypothetical protein DR864_00485 [Runella rosea]
MLLALIFTALAICLIFGEWPGPHRFEVHSETESHQEAEVYIERKRHFRTVDTNGTSAFMTDDLAVYFLKPAHEEIEKTREGWLRSLSLRHEKGELTDSEFSEEINRCLDQTAVRTLK